MILLLGSTGYIGSVFKAQLEARKSKFLTLSHFDGNSFWKAHEVLKQHRPELVINCAAFIPKESVSLCDSHQAETISGNVMFPSLWSAACQDQGIAFAHISTGCLWNDRQTHSEVDPPQRAFNGHCGFYIGTKVLSETEVRKYDKHYIWRVRLPFDEHDSERNYLSKLVRFPKVWDHTNSISHRVDFAKACLDLWRLRAPFGTYHITNPGSIKATDIVDRMIKFGIRKTETEIVLQDGGDCVLNVDKLLSTGVKMRHVNDALEESLTHWIHK